MKAAEMLLCPAVGPLFVFLSFWLYKLVMSQNMDLSDVVFGKEKTEAFIWPDEEVERNMISIEDALEITDKKSLRTFIMNVIRGDYRRRRRKSPSPGKIFRWRDRDSRYRRQ